MHTPWETDRHFEQELHPCKTAYNSPHFVVLHVEDVSSLMHVYLNGNLNFAEIQEKIYLQIAFYNVTLKIPILEENIDLVHFSMLYQYVIFLFDWTSDYSVISKPTHTIPVK